LSVGLVGHVALHQGGHAALQWKDIHGSDERIRAPGSGRGLGDARGPKDPEHPAVELRRTKAGRRGGQLRERDLHERIEARRGRRDTAPHLERPSGGDLPGPALRGIVEEASEPLGRRGQGEKALAFEPPLQHGLERVALGIDQGERDRKKASLVRVEDQGGFPENRDGFGVVVDSKRGRGEGGTLEQPVVARAPQLDIDLTPGQIEGEFYLRFSAREQAGVLATVAGILAQHGISIASVHQPLRHSSSAVPIVMMTHPTKESALRSALIQIEELREVTQPTQVIRIEREI